MRNISDTAFKKTIVFKKTMRKATYKYDIAI